MKGDYIICRNTRGEAVIMVPLRQKQLELVYDIIYEKVDHLRDEFTEENRTSNLRTQNELLRVNRKLDYALQELIKFKLKPEASMKETT